MEYKVPTFDVNTDPGGFVVDLNSLFPWLATIQDKRSRRGMRYGLATILVLIVPAKLAGEDRVSGIAEWVAHRVEFLGEALHWVKPRATYRTIYSRILGHAVDIAQFEEVVSRYFASQGQRGRRVVEVEQGENEVTAAPRLLGALDLNGKVVTGDAMFSQRELSMQVVEGGGEYIWTVKENQPQLQQDIATLFEPEGCIKGFSPGLGGFRTAETREKGHGRIERRRLTASSELKGYLDWPYAEHLAREGRTWRRSPLVWQDVQDLLRAGIRTRDDVPSLRKHWYDTSGNGDLGAVQEKAKSRWADFWDSLQPSEVKVPVRD